MKNRKKYLIIGAFVAVFVIGTIIVLTSRDKVKINIKVPNYYSLAGYYYDGDFNEFYKDTYDWYKSIENEDGVYIINTSYNSDELLNVWKNNKPLLHTLNK